MLAVLAVLYLKNRINRGWAPDEDNSNHKPIPEDERPALRERLIPSLANAPPNVRAQLVPILSKILQHDFPEKWPGFIEVTMQLLSTNDANSVFAGLQCLLSLCKVYRYKAGEKRIDFDNIVEHSFPLLLNIGNRLVDEENLEAGEMLRVILKCYKHAVYVRSCWSQVLRWYGGLTASSSNFLLFCKLTRPLWTGAHYSCESSRRLPRPARCPKMLRSERPITGGNARNGHMPI